MTDVTLKEHIEVKLEELETRIEQARIAMEKRLDGMNEFRDALRDQSQKSPTRIEMDNRFDALDKITRRLETKQAIVDSKAATWLVWVGLFFTGASFFFSLMGLLISLYVVFMK